MPSREQLEIYEDAISLLDNIKTKCSHILSSKRIILSNNLNFGNLRNEMNMYIELIMNLIDNDDISKSFDNATYYSNGTKKLEHTSKMGKLKNYLNNITRLEIETILRLVALKELLEEKTYLSPLKKNSIREEMNNLAYTFINLRTQESTIKIEVDRFLNEYTRLEKEEFVEEEIDNELIRNRCQELRSIISTLLPFELDRYDVNEDNIANIIYMEELLEKYIYNHKNEVDNLKETLKDLMRYLKDHLELESISKRISQLETKLKAFALYGETNVKMLV